MLFNDSGVFDLNNELIKCKILKSLTVLICIFAFLFQYTLSASSVDIDGYQGGVEWDGATSDLLISGESNCGVEFALVKTLIDTESSALFLCFTFIDQKIKTDNLNAGVALCVENSDQFEITLFNSYLSADSSKYSFDSAIRADENNGAICEFRIGFKYGLPETIPFSVRFIDAEGALSNVCRFSVINNFYTETTELIIDIEEKETTKAKATSKKKTTRYRTDAETVYVYITNKKSTTKKRTTKFYIQTSPPYSYVRKTKAPTTKKIITEKPNISKYKPATVYYYEKEVIISHIYISEMQTTPLISYTSALNDNITTESVTEPSTDTVYSYKEKSAFSLSKGMNYKTIVLVFGAIGFAIIAAVGVKSSRKNSDNNENPE